MTERIRTSSTAAGAALRWGVLGVADIAVKSVIPAIQRSASGRVVAIASRSAGRASAAAEQLGIERAYDSYRALLADPAVDAVYVPLPNHLHCEWTLAAAAAGKHVLCEKPLALASADARRMAEQCAAAGVVLMEAFMYRLHPLWSAALERVHCGEIGEPLAVNVLFSYFNDDPGNIRNQAHCGGGALYDVGCYAVSVARLVFGREPSGVYAAARRDAGLGTDVVTSGLLDFDGRHATFTCATQLESNQRVEIMGTAGRIVIEIPFNIPPDRPTRLLHIAGGDPPVAPRSERIELAAADPYTVQADAFARAVLSGEPPPVAPDDSIANLVTIERIIAAAEAAAHR